MTKIVHGIHVDEIGNLQDLLRLVFIHEESGYIKKVIDGRKVNRNINQKKKSDALKA